MSKSKPKSMFACYDGFLVSLDPQKNGNCQFNAIADQLRQNSMIKNDITGNIVREKVIHYMTEFATQFDGFHTANTWNDYLNDMAKETTFGDHLTFFAACCVFEVRVLILDALNESNCIFMSVCDKEELTLPLPVASDSVPLADNKSESALPRLPLCILGYYPENNGCHYVSLQATSQEHVLEVAKRVINVKNMLQLQSESHGEVKEVQTKQTNDS